MSHERAYSEFHALSNHKSKIQIYLINGNIVGKWTYLSEITLFQLPVNKAMGYKGSFTHVFFPYTAISRKVVGESARNNPERDCGWF